MEESRSDSPVRSVESLASSSRSSSGSRSHSPAPGGDTEPERSSGSGNGNVMITLSLTPDPPLTPPAPTVVTPSRPPFPSSHIRSRSLADGPDVPVMTRAHSSPGLDSRGRYIFVHGRGAPASTAAAATATAADKTPNSKPKRYLPLQLSTADSFDPSSTGPRMLHRKNISETISEHAELDTSGSSVSTTPTSHSDFNPSSPVLSHATPRLGRRRPSSPLHFPQTPTNNGAVPGSPLFSATHSPPLMLSSRYNEAFPSYSASSASSMPSTPTSLRSRSPSISSLETIPDIPDAEAEALESDRIAALKAAADRADDADAVNNGIRRRGVSDMAGPSTSLSARTGGGYRKRWSVCGAERRGDLDLETIWED
ncbi:hypothetical protein BDV06DRAFT_47725 [Aspergillus oleicola]